ncbi:MAG TPA: DJ-1/PfpI family protein [Methanotrichaceae archaeon]|nr:DJ-1/PfpI family protein [Methanotrichaceae archaeon]
MFGGNMGLAGRNIAIITSEMYEDMEVWHPYTRLIEEGANVAIVSMIDSPVEVLSLHGYPLRTDMDALEANTGEFSAAIIPGGMAPQMLRRSEAVLDLVRNLFFQGRVVAAIDQGILVLASAGDLLSGRAVTAIPPLAHEVERQSRDPLGIRWIDQDVVTDGNLITARGIAAVPNFTSEVIRAVQMTPMPTMMPGAPARAPATMGEAIPLGTPWLFPPRGL